MSSISVEALRKALTVGSTSAPTLDDLAFIDGLAWVTGPADEDNLLELSILYNAVMDRAELMLDILNGDYAPLEV